MAKILAAFLCVICFHRVNCQPLEFAGTPSPDCKPKTKLTQIDSEAWQNYVSANVPSAETVTRAMKDHSRVPRHFGSASAARDKIAIQQTRNVFITASYARLCRDRLFPENSCSTGYESDSKFYWVCAAAFASYLAGTVMEEALFAYDANEVQWQNSSALQRGGLMLVDREISKRIDALGEAGEINQSIYETMAWQYYAAEKCGSPYVISLLEIPPQSDTNRYLAKIWKESQKTPDPIELHRKFLETSEKADANPADAKDILFLEQREVQPLFQKYPGVTAQLTRENRFNSPFPEVPHFREFVGDRLGAAKAADFGNYGQRVAWQRELMAAFFLRLTNGCEGRDFFMSFGREVADRLAQTLTRFPNLTGFAAFDPRKFGRSTEKTLAAFAPLEQKRAGTDPHGAPEILSPPKY